jgi:glycosyltransferase involved in cell wall biosynthesis
MTVVNEVADLVSVVIPTQNRRAALARAIESVMQQTWPNIEIIIVDDASTDDTPQYLETLAGSSSFQIKVIRHEVAQGGAAARNKGIGLAKGQYIAFLDDDDIWMREKLRSQIELLKMHPAASSVSCSFVILHPSGKRTERYLSPPVDAQQILRANHLGGASMCLATRRMLLDIGGFDAALRSGQDWDLWIKLNDRGPVCVCPQILVGYMPHEGARITGNPHSTYAGRRRIFLRYKNRMTPDTRKNHLCEIFYCRMVLLETRLLRRVLGLIKVVGFAGLANGLRYPYRYVRSFF